MQDSRLSSHLLPLRDQASEAYAQDLIESGCRVHLPELLSADHPDAVYQHSVRHGVRVIALPTTSLTPHQLVAIMTFRLAQYLSVRHVDPHAVFCAQMHHEPLRYVGPNDLHILALEATTGSILSYLTLRTAPPGATTAISGSITMRSESRSLFPLEEYHPYAILVADCGAVQRGRLEQVEQVLSIPGTQGLRALLALRRDAHAATSGLMRG
jgi:hypothetical protein